MVTPNKDSTWVPFERQVQVLERSEDEISCGGARGGAKTDTGAVWMIEPEYVRHPRYKGLVLRIERKDLVDWFERTRWLYACVGATHVGNPSTGQAMIRFPAGGYILFGHLQDSNAYQQYMGQEFHKINFEQLEQCQLEEDYIKLLSASRSSVPELKPQIFVSWNPGGVGHRWIVNRFHRMACNQTYTYTAEIMLPNGKKITSTKTRIHLPMYVWDNPYVDPGYLATLNQLPETWRRAWLYGDVDIMAGQYLKMLDQNKHVIPYFQPHESWYHFRSLDWGSYHNAVCCWWAVDFEGNAYIYRHLKIKGMSIPALARQILDMTPGVEESRIACTIAGHDCWEKLREGQDQNATTIADLFYNESGIALTMAQTDRINGWQNLMARLDWDEGTNGKARKNPTLFIMSNCQEIYDDLCLLIHDDNHPEDAKKQMGDDVGDCVRYGARHIQAASFRDSAKTYMDTVFDRLEGWDRKADTWGAGMLAGEQQARPESLTVAETLEGALSV